MTKKHEELVEEIAEYLTKSYRKGFQACVNHHKPEEGIVPEGDAKRIIPLTLSAVRDGRLDKELGVVYRNRFRGYQEVGSLFLASDRGDATLPGSFHIDPPLNGEEIEVIAFRKEGTSKEE